MTKKQLVMFFIVLGILVLGIIFAEVKTAAKYNEYMNTLKSMQADLEKEPVSKASWYDYQLDGIWWSKDHRTAASRDFPRGSTLKVCNVLNNACVEVFVNDHGPDGTIHPDRAIDLSSYAFSQISDLSLGLANVSIERIK